MVRSHALYPIELRAHSGEFASSHYNGNDFVAFNAIVIAEVIIKVIIKVIVKVRRKTEVLILLRLSWKWRKRSSVKIAERTYEEGTEAFHPRRKSGHPEAASCGQSASLGAV
jgi:hypothetical protein